MYIFKNYIDGITQKNLSTTNGGIGLNPNLNIEDEYIENLLKQTHFLNMEIKLMYFIILSNQEKKNKNKIKEWALWEY